MVVKKNSVGTSTQSRTTVLTEEPEILPPTTTTRQLPLSRSPETFEATKETTIAGHHLAVKQLSDDERLWPEGTSHEKIATGGSGDVYKVTFNYDSRLTLKVVHRLTKQVIAPTSPAPCVNVLIDLRQKNHFTSRSPRGGNY